MKRLSILLAFLTLPLSTHAALIDFTDNNWASTASLYGVGVSYGTSTIGDSLTFNATDNAGCIDGNNAGVHTLACDGDGLGIGDDEISQSGSGNFEIVRLTFDDPTQINNILLLDLFGNEQTGENAVIGQYGGSTTTYHATNDNSSIGGFFSTGFIGTMSYIDFMGFSDSFSDFALAAIDIGEDIQVSPVPLPGAVFLFGSALLGFMGFKRFSK